jgi:5-methylcytosine-specific restriction endonuclease McrA
MKANRWRLKLSTALYRRLWRTVLERDGWRCQGCGSLRHLEVHHFMLRSQLGADADTNLITLCANCHRHIHFRGPLSFARDSTQLRSPAEAQAQNQLKTVRTLE